LLRTTGSTELNVNHASRSHAILQLKLVRHGKCVSKFNLVDLAGSERSNEAGEANRESRIEGNGINQSLLALKECIRALTRKHTVKILPNSTEVVNNDYKAGHVPFRASKLTMCLKDSLVGSDILTIMIATISPALNSVDHTLNTLKYARRIKTLRVRREKRRLSDVAIEDLELEDEDVVSDDEFTFGEDELSNEESLKEGEDEVLKESVEELKEEIYIESPKELEVPEESYEEILEETEESLTVETPRENDETNGYAKETIEVIIQEPSVILDKVLIDDETNGYAKEIIEANIQEPNVILDKVLIDDETNGYAKETIEVIIQEPSVILDKVLIDDEQDDFRKLMKAHRWMMMQMSKQDEKDKLMLQNPKDYLKQLHDSLVYRQSLIDSVLKLKGEAERDLKLRETSEMLHSYLEQ